MADHHRPRKRFAQHFLVDQHVVAKVVDAANLSSESTVLEIGPGKGKLTRRLLERAGDVWAVEIDRDLVPILRERFEENERFHLVESDILQLDPAVIDTRGERISVVANIPYNITTPIIEYIIQNRAHFSQAILLMQREVAVRLFAGPGTKEYGLTSLNFGLYGTGKRLFDVRPAAFNPPPAVVSSVVRLDIGETCRFPLEDDRLFHALTGAVFRQRRKMVRNTFVQFMRGRGMRPVEALGILDETGIAETLRPEEIDLASFVALTNRCAEAFGSEREGNAS